MARLSHVGLTVSNLDRSLAFYRDVAGMNEGAIVEGENRQSGAPVRMRMIHLASGSFLLQLIEYNPPGKTLELQQNNIGCIHISFYVPDVDAKYAEIKARGDVKITTPINQMGSQLRGFYTEDPDGLPVEFVQSVK
jgi:catechol 2,3-dioxygenase-like lactoylglutathione lyase family enzyme